MTRHASLLAVLCIVALSLSAGCASEPPPPDPETIGRLPPPPETPTPVPPANPVAAAPAGQGTPAPGAATPAAGQPPPPPVDGHGPPGAVIGKIVDAGTGSRIKNAVIVELGASPVNAATQTAAGFLIRPTSWPVQLFSWEEGALHSMVALTEDSYRRAPNPVTLRRWTKEGGLAWFEETFGMAWAEGVGVVIADIQPPEIRAAEGVTATISSKNQLTWVFDSKGKAQAAHTIVADPEMPWIVWTGVAPGPATVTVKPHPGLTCVGATKVEVLARSIVHVPFVCTPAS